MGVFLLDVVLETGSDKLGRKLVRRYALDLLCSLECFQFKAYLIPHSSRSVNIWLHINLSCEAWSQVPWCTREKYQTLKNFIMSMSYRRSKKLWDFADSTCVFNRRPACLYASSKAPRCPFRMIFRVQLLVYSVQRRPLHIWMFHKHIIKTH